MFNNNNRSDYLNEQKIGEGDSNNFNIDDDDDLYDIQEEKINKINSNIFEE